MADTDSESGAEASDVEDSSRKKKRDDDDEPQQKLKHRLQQMVDYQPGDRLKEGTQIFILLSFQQKV